MRSRIGVVTPMRAVSALGAVLLLGACSAPRADPSAVDRVLDGFHDAAAAADARRYLGHLAADGVFIGTDASERWTKEEFRAFVEPRFGEGRGWTYRPRDRHVTIAPSGAVAWFDELLDSPKYGECRGTGSLVRAGGTWRIAQYVLTLPIPNEIALDVVARVREAARSGAAEPDADRGDE